MKSQWNIIKVSMPHPLQTTPIVDHTLQAMAAPYYCTTKPGLWTMDWTVDWTMEWALKMHQ